MKFTDKYVMCTEKHVLVEKISTYGLNMGLPLSQKEVHKVEAN